MVPQRIVSLAPSNTEILYALGAGPRMVAVTELCDYPPEARKKPNVGGWTNAKPELVLQHKPDLVLTSTFLQDQIAEELRARGLNVLHVRPFTLGEVLESFVTIGEAIGAREKGTGLAGRVKNDLREIQNKTKPCCSKRPRVYCEEWPNPPMVSGNWVPELVELAGGTCGLITPGEPSRAVSLDELVRFEPEVIALNICGAGEHTSADLLRQREGWSSLSSVENNRVHVIDDSLLNRPGPRLAEGAGALAKLLHPEAF